jgi:hypothetical protein
MKKKQFYFCSESNPVLPSTIPSVYRPTYIGSCKHVEILYFINIQMGEMCWYTRILLSVPAANNSVIGHCPSYGVPNNRKHNVSKLHLLPSSDEAKKTPTNLVPLERAIPNAMIQFVPSKGPNRVGVIFHPPEDGSRPSLRNVVFSIYLEFPTMDNRSRKPSDSVRDRCQSPLESTETGNCRRQRATSSSWSDMLLFAAKVKYLKFATKKTDCRVFGFRKPLSQV